MSELNKLEIETLKLLHFSLLVSPEEKDKYSALLLQTFQQSYRVNIPDCRFSSPSSTPSSRGSAKQSSHNQYPVSPGGVNQLHSLSPPRTGTRGRRPREQECSEEKQQERSVGLEKCWNPFHHKELTMYTRSV